MSLLPKDLWHDGWNQAAWDRHCRHRLGFAVLMLVSGSMFAVAVLYGS